MKYVIYKIVCNNIEVPYIYVGSTKNFINRKSLHKSNSNDKKTADRKVYRIINEHGGWDNWTMVKIESCFCEKVDAKNIEQKYYDELNENKMNMIRPMRNSEQVKNAASEYYNNNKIAILEKSKQYRTDNKIAISEISKQYKTANKETIEKRAAEKIHCKVCDCYNRKDSITKHNKTPKHQNNITHIHW